MMMVDDLFDVRLTADFDIMSSLLNVHAIESFDDAKIVEWILHALLYLLAYRFGDGKIFGADKEVVDLSKDHNEAMFRMVLKI